MGRILIIEDEVAIATFVESGLCAAGHTTMAVHNGREGAALARDGAFDLVILDLGIPGLDGLSVLRQIRSREERLPVIILTARNELDATLESFEGGADDFMTKPFRFEELLARVTARLTPQRGDDEGLQRLVVGASTLDLERRTINIGDTSHELSSREFKLAVTLFRHPGQVLSREQLLSRSWGYEFDPGSNVVDVYIGYLRRKLGRDAIETVRGAGYRLRN
ncbi:MAG: response regulator transcription factor [Actinomycetia bacterium]|nr:response regulator transcription factor [Actinomycetes bacterium]